MGAIHKASGKQCSASGKIVVPLEDIAREVDGLNNKQPGGWTIKEWAKETGHSANWCRERMADMIDAGIAEYVGDGKRYRIDGKPCFVACYRLLREAE